MLFSVGTGYFMFVINGESQYSQALANRTQGLQSQLTESLKITPASGASNHLVFTATNVGGTAANITDVFVLDPSGVTRTYGLGFGPNTTPALPGGVTPQNTSASYDTGITIVPGTYTIKVITHRGNAYTATYPVPPATSFASSTGSLTVALSSFRWVQLTGTSSIKQENYVANCNAALCGVGFSSNVASGDTLVYALGAANHIAPATPTDTRGNTFTLGAANTVTTPSTTPPTLVQKRYTSNCASSLCGLAYSSNVATGNTLAFALGWLNQSPPSTPTDTLGNTYTLGVSQSLAGTAPTLVQKNYNSNCNSASCGLAYTSSIVSGNTLAFALGWYGQNPPSTPTDTRGNTFTLGVSNSVSAPSGNAATLVQKNYNSNCNSASCGLAYTSNVVSGNTLAFALGWYNQSPPSTPTDTRGNTFTLGVSNSVTAAPTLVQKNYISNCNSASCGLAFTQSVVSGNTLAFALGWSGQNPPSTPTDTRGNTFTLGASNSVTAGGGTPSLVQRKYVPNCSSASCGAAFTSSVTVGDILVFGLGWPNNAPPSTPTDTLGDTYQLAVSNSVGAGSLALDGFTSNQASSTSVSSPLTTTNSNDVIYVSVTAKGGTGINTPTATGLTFTLRKSAGTTPKFATYYAIASSPLSAVSITATASGASYVIMNAFGVSGANTASPFDSNAAIPASNTGTGNSHSVTISTSNANDFLIGPVGIDDPTDACSTATALGGFTKITDKGNVLRWGASEYKIVSATQTSLSVTMSSNCSSSSTWVMIGDAVQAGSTYYSYIWYATAGSTGADTITASFSSSVAGSVSMYEIAGYTPLSPLTSTGSSATGSTSATVTSFTPSSNSFVVGNLETGASSTMYTTGSGYASVLTGAGGCDPTHSAQGCSEYQSGLGSATTVPFTLSASTPWVESAISFAPNTYYSYIWYATSGSSGADTITASFSSSVTGSVSIYEISRASTTSPSTSIGSSSAGSTAVSVTSFTPAANSFVIGNAETSSSTSSFTVVSGYTLSGTCSSVYGCGEYQAGLGSATTVPFTLGVAATWVESAIAFTP